MKRTLSLLMLALTLSACGNGSSEAGETRADTAAKLPDTPPPDGSCVGWQQSLSKGYRTDEVESCLLDKARMDRPAAVQDAIALSHWQIKEGNYSELLPLIAALTQFPEAGSLEQYLRTLNVLTKQPDEDTHLDATITVSGFLQQLGNIYWFDAETGMFPNEHDALMTEVATLSDLQDVEFTETAPSDYRADDEPYLLHATINDHTYQTQAENYGDWYDIEAVLMLLNKVAVKGGFKSRFTLLPTTDQTAIIWIADTQALTTLSHRGLIGLSDASLAMVTGKAFEQAVKAALKSDTQ